jgi:nucleoside-diphosphate-sugar epimerase
MKRAIVTGATGFIGQHLVRELIAGGVDVTALCRRQSLNLDRLPPGVKTVYDIDYLDSADVFYHLAWECDTGLGVVDPALQARNTELTLRALVAANGLGCRKFISVGSVYESFASQIRSHLRTGKNDIEILTKNRTHTMAKQLAFRLGMDFIWCKLCYPIGSGVAPHRMVSRFISDLLAGIKPVFDPGQGLCDMIAVEDVARALQSLGNHKGYGRWEYYIGSGAPKPQYKWLEKIQSILGTGTALSIGEGHDDGLKLDEKCFDLTPLREDTGFEPTFSFEQTVWDVAAWVANAEVLNAS